MYLLLGAEGYVASAFSRYFTANNIPYFSSSHKIASEKDVEEILNNCKARVIINCIGYTGRPNIDNCENHKAECLFVNSVLPRYISNVCERHDVIFGHVSTGDVFNSSDSIPLTENDTINCGFGSSHYSWYSATKVLGEEILSGTNSYIWRIRMPFSNINHPKNYLSKIIQYDTLLDVPNSITDIDEFVKNAQRCIEEKVPFGVYHMVCSGGIRASEIVTVLSANHLSQSTKTYLHDPTLLKTKTPRMNCVLSTNKLENLGINCTPVKDAITRAIQNWQV